MNFMVIEHNVLKLHTCIPEKMQIQSQLAVRIGGHMYSIAQLNCSVK